MHSNMKQIAIKSGHARLILCAFHGTLKYSMIGFFDQVWGTMSRSNFKDFIYWSDIRWDDAQ